MLSPNICVECVITLTMWQHRLREINLRVQVCDQQPSSWARSRRKMDLNSLKCSLDGEIYNPFTHNFSRRLSVDHTHMYASTEIQANSSSRSHAVQTQSLEYGPVIHTCRTEGLEVWEEARQATSHEAGGATRNSTKPSKAYLNAAARTHYKV